MASEPGFQPHSKVIYSPEVDFTKVLDLSVLKGKTILITGGASGFGAACANLWAAHGANIMVGDINSKLGVEVVAKLRTDFKNPNHHFFYCDVAQWKSQASFFREAAKASPHGGIDVVVANAGVANNNENTLFEEPPDYSQMQDPEEPKIMRTIGINLCGVFYTTHLALSYLPRNPGSQACSVDSKSGGEERDRQLILVSSMAGLAPLPRTAPYCAAKHGVVGLFRSLRITAPVQHGVRVNMVNPYFVKTPILGFDGGLVLAGGPAADIQDVVDTMTRFVTDQGIIGRGCVVGVKGTEEEIAKMKLPHVGPVWDVFADDFAQSDLFTRRIVGITNLQTAARGWIGMYKDIIMAFAGPIVRMITG